MLIKIFKKSSKGGPNDILTEVEKNLKGGTKGYFLSLIHEKYMWLPYSEL
jgi:hypothetical protein